MALSNAFSVTIAQSALQAAAAALSNGSSASFAAGIQTAFDQADLAWQTNFHHDPARSIVHLMGKPANADTSWKHEYFNMATSTWTVVSPGQWNNSGHIYGNFAIDWATGDLYITRSSAGSDAPRRARRFVAANGLTNASWSNTMPPSTDVTSGAIEAHANGVVHHPNLYGTGEGALLWPNQTWVWAIRTGPTNTGAVQQLSTAYMGDYGGPGCYSPALNAAFVGGSGGVLIRVTPNATPGGTPVVTSMGNPPITLGGFSHQGGGTFGSLHVHPNNANKLMILGTTGQQCYESTNGSSWTTLASHPFTQTPRVICSLRGGLGCFWSIGRTDAGANFSTLWKPAP